MCAVATRSAVNRAQYGQSQFEKKSKNFSTSTTTASKYIPKRPRICINWNPSFQTKIDLVKVPLKVNIVKQDLLNKKQVLKILWSEFWKGGFQLIQILGLLGMYFDAVVVEVKTFLLLFRLALAILCIGSKGFQVYSLQWKLHFRNALVNDLAKPFESKH